MIKSLRRRVGGNKWSLFSKILESSTFEAANKEKKSGCFVVDLHMEENGSVTVPIGSHRRCRLDVPYLVVHVLCNYHTVEPRKADIVDPNLSGRARNRFGLVRKILRKYPCLGIRYQSVAHATITIEALHAQFSALARPLWGLEGRNRLLERFNVQQRTD